MFKKWLLVLVLLLSLFFLTGCWDRTEVNDVALITGLAIDQKNKKTIELTAEMHIPKALGVGGGAGGPQTFVRTGEGHTIADAISNRRGIAAATYFMLLDLGYGIGSYLLGILSSFTGYRPMIFMAGMFGALSAFVYYFLYLQSQKAAKNGGNHSRLKSLKVRVNIFREKIKKLNVKEGNTSHQL